MRTIYFDCAMGASGDMLMGALLELLPDQNVFLDKMNALNLPGVKVTAEPSSKCGIMGTHVHVFVSGEEESHEHNVYAQHMHGHASHHHTDLHEIAHLIGHLDVPEPVRKDALAVYNAIAQAECRVHNTSIDQIHFHEVGTLDALADVVGVCWLIHQLAPDAIYASAVHVGSGQVQCAHGILPVPAPATALLLEGIPCYGGNMQGELCTPTGAALLRHFVTKFAPIPQLCVEKIGYGMGTKDFEAANCVRALLGRTPAQTEQIVELCCNLDDMTAEEIGFAMERMFEAGAVDVYTTPVGMKKNRPGILLTCMCRESKREKLVQEIFRHTTTLGVRATVCDRYTLSHTECAVETACGPVHVKTASGFGIQRKKAEYEDLARVARETNSTLYEAKSKLFPDGTHEYIKVR